MSASLIVGSVATAIVAATPILIAASGELLSQTVGVYNIGIEGSMLCGALGAFAGASATHSVILSLLAGMAAGALAALCFGVVVVVLRADMVVAGIALVFIALGITGVLGGSYVRAPAPVSIPSWHIPLLASIPYVGRALFRGLSLSYIAFVMPVGAWFLLYRTRHGLNMRAIGEDPATADVTGINVNGWRLFYVSVAGACAGLGGATLSLATVGTWLPDVTAGEGYIALAIVIFASWRPFPLILGALLFGALGTLGNVAQALGVSIPAELFSALPYIGTLAVVCLLAWKRVRRSAWPPWPASLGLPFFRGAS